MANYPGLGSAWALQKEVTYGTSIVSAQRQVPILSENLKLDISRIDSKTLKGGNSIVPSSSWRPGPKTGSGSVQMLLYNAGAALLWQAMLGGLATTGSGPYTHTFTPAATLPSYTIETGFGGASSSFARKKMVGAKVKSWNLKLAAKENATLGMDWVYKDEVVAASTAVDGSAPGTQYAYNFTEGVITGDKAPTGCIQNFELKGDNSLKDDLFCLGSSTFSEPVYNDFRSITGTMDTTFDGTTTNYAAYTAGTEGSLILTLTSTASVGDTITITLNVRLDGSTPTVQGPGLIMVSIPFTVLAASTDASAMTVAVVNGDATP